MKSDLLANSVDDRRNCRHIHMLDCLMSALKRRILWRGLAVVLPFALCITIGMVVGIGGGLHNEAAMQYYPNDISAPDSLHEAIRLYGALVFLPILSASALTTVALFVSGITFPGRRRPGFE